MRMKLSKEKCLLHVSTIALSGLLFTNMPGVINAAENNDVSNEQSAKQSALVQNSETSQSLDDNPNASSTTLVADGAEDQPDTASSSNTQTHPSAASKADANEVSKAAAAESTTNQQKAVQNNESQKSAAISEGQTGQDASTKHQGEQSSYAALPKAGHVDHPESGAVIAIIIGIVISTVALIRVRRQNP